MIMVRYIRSLISSAIEDPYHNKARPSCLYAYSILRALDWCVDLSDQDFME